VDYLAKLIKWPPCGYLINAEPSDVLDRAEAYLLRAGYATPLVQGRTSVSAHFCKTQSLGDFLGLTDTNYLDLVVSQEGTGQTRLTIKPNSRAKVDAERVVREEFNVL
jgi:hypothetical protein